MSDNHTLKTRRLHATRFEFIYKTIVDQIKSLTLLCCVLYSIKTTLYVVTAASLSTVQCRKISKKRTSLPLWKKYDIVNEVNRRNYTPVSMLAKGLEVSKTSLITILKDK